MSRPEFIVLGAGKSGTTSIYKYLQQNPEVFLPSLKETYFFAFEGEHHPKGIVSPEQYFALYDNVSGGTIPGEVSSVYLYRAKAADRIKHYVPHAKLIAVLRNPIHRTFSDYQFHCRNLHASVIDPKTGKLRTFEQQIAHSDYFIDLSLYYEQLRRYFERFDRNQIRIFLFDDLVEEPAEFMRELSVFIGCKSAFQYNVDTVHNVSGKPVNFWLQDLLNNPDTFPHKGGGLLRPIWSACKRVMPEKLRMGLREKLSASNVRREAMSSETRAMLRLRFEDDIYKVSSLIERDLTFWLTDG